ncbi:arylsulfatase A-like enzyme [Algoriphagus ratkowskyi]|uniref:Arylsulfatase A-like enzyme n=2 Tax=Algoriphagus ratkowskyi TaxID=57028 RepID=A0A2W7RKJ5_9BACT|nr:arylsulfatase A-like enzyme [Algoriphagus ratkowskyi]
MVSKVIEMKTLLTHIITLALVLYPFFSQATIDTLTKNPAPTHYNLVLIVADDLGYGDLGFTGSTQIKTPKIDKLAASGVTFTQGYVSSAVCSPSRAGFITGINQVEFGHDNNLGGVEPGFDPEYNGLPLTQQTIADHLNKLGYVNGLIGKWHLGKEPQFHPLKRGFDEFWGYTGGGHDYFEALPNGTGYKEPLESNFKTPAPITYITDDVGNESVDFITRHKDEPFFLFAAFNAPHTPMQALEEDLALYQNIADKKRRTYAAMVHRLDLNVGKIMQSLEDQGLKENTLVVFISDNGGPTDSNASNNAPYRGQKGILLEGGIHVPFVMNLPSLLPKGLNYDEQVTSLDIVPTFLALAGDKETDMNMFTGLDLLPHLTGKTAPLANREMTWKFTISRAIREGDWKLVSIPDRMPMLYNLADDPSEQNDLALKNLDKTTYLLKKLGNWDVNLPHPVFLEGAVWKKRQLSLYEHEYEVTQPKTK